MSVRRIVTEKLQEALDALFAEGVLSGDVPRVVLAPPKQADHGDFACTVALALGQRARKNPRDVATALQAKLGDAAGMLRKTEIAGPGYLNLFVTDQAWHDALAGMLAQGGEAFVRSNVGAGQRVLVEYVSANPTGPLHIAHGRGAVTGDVLARLLDLAGFHVEREYYINDMGHQTEVMARSVYLRYAELFGRAFDAPEDFYPGEYITEIAVELKAEVGDRYLDQPESAWLSEFRERGMARMMDRIKADLAAFGIEFDRYVSERALVARMDLPGFVALLESRGHIYDEDGKKWFRSTAFGDDKDRVVIREDGRPTYFASDIAYHYDKLQRGFDQLINVWGADHGGYIARVKAGISALGYEADRLDVVLVQMVSLCRGDQAVRMGKRLGTAVWLRDVINEAGKDATRYFFVMRRTEAQMDFDVDLATKKSIDNPVYYAQMGYARMSSILRKAEEAGVPLPVYTPGALQALVLPEELGLIKTMCRAPDVVADAAIHKEPHAVVTYLQELIAQFHSYYTQYKRTERVISDDPAKTCARLLLCMALRSLLATLLHTVGVSAPESMYLDAEAELV